MLQPGNAPTQDVKVLMPSPHFWYLISLLEKGFEIRNTGTAPT